MPQQRSWGPQGRPDTAKNKKRDVYHISLKKASCGEGDGRDVQEEGDKCISMVNSCWGLRENSKIMLSNYPSIKK